MGIGAGAHGALQLGKELIRYENPADLGLYAAMACERQFFVGRRIPLREQMFERVMLNTRRLQGLDEAEFQRDFDVPFVQCFPESCRKAIEFGLAQRKDGWFLLTQRGLEVQNAMLAQQIEETEISNAALEYSIQNSESSDTLEDIARSKLGLVYPGEKVFYDVGN